MRCMMTVIIGLFLWVVPGQPVGTAVHAQGPGGDSVSPTPVSTSGTMDNPGTSPRPDPGLKPLVDAVRAENLQWENVTFWGDSVLGDESLAPLMIRYKPGQMFPAFEMTLLDGTVFSLSTVEGPAVVNFWASWCGSCRLELPLLLDAHADVNAPFELLLVNAWDEYAAYEQFVTSELPGTVISGRASNAFIEDAGIEAIPVSILLDQSRYILAVHVGNMTESVMAFYDYLAKATDSSQEFTVPPLVPGESAGKDLELLASEVMLADLENGSTTVWRGGVLGLAESGRPLVVHIGEKLPAFGFHTIQGDVFRSDVMQQAYLLNFWASWCGPCVTEFPLLIAADRQPDANFGVAFVNIWDDPYSYEAFLDDYPADILAMIDGHGVLPDLYGIDLIPVSILIDETGIVQLIQKGPVNEAVLEFASELLRQP